METRPEWAPGWVALGNVLFDSERMDDASRAFARAVQLDPRLATAWNNLGLAHAALDRNAEARQAFEAALAVDPRYALAHFNLARLRNNGGDTQGALASALEAARLDPRRREVHLLIGDLHRKRQEFGHAIEAYRTAVAVAPADTKARNALAELLWEVGALDEARSHYRENLSIQPHDLKSALGSRLALPPVYASAEQLAQCRREYEAGLTELRGQAPALGAAGSKAVLDGARWTNFYLAYQGRDDRRLQAEYGDFLAAVLGVAAPELLAPLPWRPGARLRVGFFSHFFFDCTAGRYFASWVRDLDPARFETFVYYTNPQFSDFTRAIADRAGHFRHLPGRTPGVLAQHVLADRLDVLVYPELGMHPDTFLMAALRLAPVQCAGWGHPTTTGLATIDWFLSCAEMEPPGAADSYRERLALLPGLGTNYGLPADAEGAGRAELGLPEGRHLYLVPQSVFKVHPDNDDLIAEVLANDPGSAAVMFAAGPPALIDAFVRRIKPALAARGLSPGRDLIFLPALTHGAYLAVNRACDVMIDTLHWSGGNTSLDAIAMGLPIATLPGPLMRGRQSAAMLRLMGLGELVAQDRDGLVAVAGRLGTQADYRREVSLGLKERACLLFGQRAPVEALQDFLDGLRDRPAG